MPRRLLVVVTTDVQGATLREHVRRLAGEDAELLVVAPASDISRLGWLTNAEDDARAEARSLAHKAAKATPTMSKSAIMLNTSQRPLPFFFAGPAGEYMGAPGGAY